MTLAADYGFTLSTMNNTTSTTKQNYSGYEKCLLHPHDLRVSFKISGDGWIPSTQNYITRIRATKLGVAGRYNQ